MKYLALVYFLLLSQGLFAQTSTEPLNVLFVGNSLTYFNNIPQTFKAIAEEQGYYINLDQHTPGGSGFSEHIENTELFQKLDNTVWDFVILQPGTSESIELSQPIEFTIFQAKQLRDKIYENSPCASVYLYETSYGIVDNSAEELQQYLDTQILIKNNLTQMSNQTSLPLVPVGETFQTSIQLEPSHFLWISYGDIHQNEKGSFLAACTFYNALFQKPILDSSVNSILTEINANYFRQIAETITLNNLDVWNIDSLTANANFTYSYDDVATVIFNNTSINYDSVLWNFGDGTTSTEINPIHIFDFNSQAVYDVYLTAFLGCKKSYFKSSISVFTLGEHSNILVSDISLFPNPVKSELQIVSNNINTFNYILYDVNGKKIRSEQKIYSSCLIDTSYLQKGLYFIEISSNTSSKTQKIIKQ